ncbi:MAG TPA: hypothetical protein VLM38_16375 [Blastocatellia bacterium]|nr:hypothetical protein [Blastocatellia bacterium]
MRTETMKKMIIAFVLSIALVGFCGAQQKKTDLEHAGLLGKVKTVKVEEAKISNKSGKPGEGKRVHVETQSYSDHGVLTKAIRFDAGRATDYFYSYDSSGNRLEFNRTAVGEARLKTEFKLDAVGNRIEETQTGEQGLVNKIVCIFDAKGRMVEKRIFNKQGLFARRAYAYGADANPTHEIEYDSKGALVGQQSYAYEVDSTGNWIKRTTSTQGTSGGKAVAEPAEVTYRTITYY